MGSSTWRKQVAAVVAAVAAGSVVIGTPTPTVAAPADGVAARQ